MASKSSLNDPEGNLMLEVTLRIILAVIFFETEYTEPFRRKIHPEELWLYKNPRTDSYVPTSLLWPLVFSVPLFFIFLCCSVKKDKVDGFQAALGLSLALGINGAITNTVKIVVGRPRPDFFWRCFPDGQANMFMNCSGNHQDVVDGLKSFPSGHSSFAFASLGFTSLYLAGKMHCFSARGRGQTWRLCLVFLPLMMALLIALSRTADYHHHWQDVLVGSVLGMVVTYICYRQYYPPLDSPNSDSCYMALTPLAPTADADVENQNHEVKLTPVKWI